MCFFESSFFHEHNASRITHVGDASAIHPFYCRVIVHCLDVPQCVYPFHHWMSGLFSGMTQVSYLNVRENVHI